MTVKEHSVRKRKVQKKRLQPIKQRMIPETDWGYTDSFWAEYCREFSGLGAEE